jgi:tetratricopeptide (TPR) repeat protein
MLIIFFQKKLLLLLGFALLFSADHIVAQNNFENAKELYETEQYEAAKKLLEPLRAKQENDTAVQSLLGSVYAKLELWEKAADQVEGLVDEYPENAEYQFRYGGALGMEAKNANKFTALMMLDDVKHHLKKATQLDKNHINSRWALVQLYVELPGVIGGTKANAMKYAKQLENISPVDGGLAKGFVEKSEENYQKAEEYLQKAVEIGQSATTYTKLAELYVEMEQEKKALETIEKGITQTDDFTCKIKFAKLAEKYQSKTKEALGYLNELEKDDLTKVQKEELENTIQTLKG